jgi:hypothetical protein
VLSIIEAINNMLELYGHDLSRPIHPIYPSIHNYDVVQKNIIFHKRAENVENESFLDESG